MICNRNQPVAELRAVEQKRTEPRPVAGGAQTFDVPASFFEPLSDVELDDWNGSAAAVTPRTASRVAERPPKPYGSPARRKTRR